MDLVFIMGLKIIIPTLGIILMLVVFLVAVQPASAVSKTEIKVYQYDLYDPLHEEIHQDLWIKKGQYLALQATIHINGGNQEWMKMLHFYIFNSAAQIVNEERSTGLGGVANFDIDTRNWGAGTYTIGIAYLDEDIGYPIAGHDIELHIV
jgi:hypothetical protein